MIMCDVESRSVVPSGYKGLVVMGACVQVMASLPGVCDEDPGVLPLIYE